MPQRSGTQPTSFKTNLAGSISSSQTPALVGITPRLELFTKKDNLREGAVPYGAPTHQDMLNVMTPQEYRAPAADFTSLLRWFSGNKK